MKAKPNEQGFDHSDSGFVMLQLPTAVNAASTDQAIDQADTTAEKQRAEKLRDAARKALVQGDKDLAIARSELAVGELPRDADSRMLLGRSYLAAGRFGSADAAFSDALALDPTLTRAAINRALAQIALGERAGALASLDRVATAGNEADIGLALALLGELERAGTLLETAAHMPGAAPRVRQNLALVYAMQGRWSDAAVVAAQDVPADQLPERLRHWATVLQLRDQPAMLVGALLGVLPGNDPGRPIALALAPPVSTVPVGVEAVAVALPTTRAAAILQTVPATIHHSAPAVAHDGRTTAFSGLPRMRGARAAHRRTVKEDLDPPIFLMSQRSGKLTSTGRSRSPALMVHSSVKATTRLATMCIATRPKLQLGRVYRIAFDGARVSPGIIRYCAKVKGGRCPDPMVSRSYRRPVQSPHPTNA